MMKYLKYGKSNYQKNPYITPENKEMKLFSNSINIVKEINDYILNSDNKNLVISFEYYYGVNEKQIYSEIISKLNVKNIVNAIDFKKDEHELSKMLHYWLTDDRIFGKMSFIPIKNFLNTSKINSFCKQKNNGITLIYGTASSCIRKPDLIVYFDINRWEIQTRQRNGQDNWGAKNYNEDSKRKYKRSYFVEWRTFDEYKKQIFDKIDYWVDSSDNELKMVFGAEYREELKNASNKPLRLVPFFDPGVWGGQWMKEVMNLSDENINYAWCFDFVAEENSINIKIENKLFNTPANNTIIYKPEIFLGSEVYARFGAEWPIRSDLLDCMSGQNLSLHVHPLIEYAYKKYGIHYTQDETYYILDGKENQSVYLGFKNNVVKDEFRNALYDSNYKGKKFMINNYINKFKSNKHEHYLIPAGTPHCAGVDTMVLEISANPYIFTLRMWDWGRVDFDGKPRSIKIDEAMDNIQLKFNEKYTKENLCFKPKLLEQNEKFTHELTAYHDREFIVTERFTFKNQMLTKNNGNFSLIHLVEGLSVEIFSPDDKFEAFVLNYAEVVAMPAGINKYGIKSINDSNFDCEYKILKSYVKC